MSKKLKILFLCTGNSCRSQMAEGWARHLKSSIFEAYSAGIETHGLNPYAVKVMKEAGVDISGHRSKKVSEVMYLKFDYVITVCGDAGENCPIFPGKVKIMHAGFDDPPKMARNCQTEEEALNCYRKVRDEIKNFIITLPDVLNDKPSAGKTENPQKTEIGFFEKYLTVWVIFCMAAGILIGKFLPAIPGFLGKFEYARVSVPIAVLIWLMIYPMMMKVDFTSITNVKKNPKGLYVTWITNWLIKPFTMYAVAYFFLFVIFKTLIPGDLAKDYLAGAILLGAAPCTAMVFVWSHLTRGNAAYTVVQVATNDLIILIAFTPIVAFLLGIGGVVIPWNTLVLSIVLFVVFPLAGGIVTRINVIKKKGLEYFNNRFVAKFNNLTIGGLLLTLVIIFSFQGRIILDNPLHIFLIAVPLTIQTFLIFFTAYLLCKKLKLSHDIAAPAGMIGASNFFELAVAVAISLFGSSSPVVLATIVGVLVEVPVMLGLVKIANNTSHWFPERKH